MRDLAAAQERSEQNHMVRGVAEELREKIDEHLLAALTGSMRHTVAKRELHDVEASLARARHTRTAAHISDSLATLRDERTVEKRGRETAVATAQLAGALMMRLGAGGDGGDGARAKRHADIAATEVAFQVGRRGSEGWEVARGGARDPIVVAVAGRGGRFCRRCRRGRRGRRLGRHGRRGRWKNRVSNRGAGTPSRPLVKNEARGGRRSEKGRPCDDTTRKDAGEAAGVG